MKTKILFIFLFSILAPIIGFSQVEKDDTVFIIFDNGEKIIGHKLKKKSGELFLDDNVYKSKSIMFYQNKSGNFANTSFGFQKRFINGKVSVYSFSFLNPNLNPKKKLNPISSYYAIDNSFVKRASYSNLKEDLKSNIVSLQHLKISRNLCFVGIGMIGIGTGITIHSFSQAFHPNRSFNIPNTIYVGLAAYLIGAIILEIAPLKMFKAIQTYNNSSNLKL